MKSIVRVRKNLLTSDKLANPFSDVPMEERLKKVKAIDLRDNYWIEDLGNGFGKIHAIDPTKIYK
ncbi:hypothetical protein [Paenibacillus shenyangensis]|uniref:hypothetical protein n=1 Tax=Paenibacillus sp. A9 TaxID=1284352 RepID=UPI00037B9B97|nr:hypothetical protein [Paenibacillus sp. A9]